MHSNFISPPDYVETVLILNAPPESIKILATQVELASIPYNIYFYNDEMNQRDWLDLIKTKADIILDAKLKDPLEYFDK
jgi:hypothetical protein